MKSDCKTICIAGFTGILPLISLGCKTAANSSKEVKLPKQYNIIYIMSDDHSQQTMSCYDRRYIQTPNMDRIANEGVRFTESFVANSISGPSRACMLTGKHSHKNGKLNNSTEFDGNQQTMPKLLQKAGYNTAIFGKWHLESIPQGFTKWCILPGQGDYYDPQFIIESNIAGKKSDTISKRGYVTNLITDMSLDWLEHRDKSKPFALFIHHKAAHRNWMADTVDLNAYEDRDLPIPSTFWDDYATRQGAANQEMSIYKDMDMVYDLKMMKKDVKTRLSGAYTWNNDTQGIHGGLRPEVKKAFDKFYDPIIRDFYAKNPQGKDLAVWKYQRYMKDYMKIIKSLDRNIGRVLDYLKEHNLLENTLIVYTSDQGFYMGEHGWFDKRFMYEESMRTPLIMRLPQGLNKRGDVTQMVQNIDYAPTFLDLAGVRVPQDMQGRSLLPLLKDNKPLKPDAWRKGLYYHFYEYPGEHKARRHYGIRGERYKLIHFYNDFDEWELFDLKKDPNELRNVYNKPEYKAVRDSMLTELKKLEVQYDAPIKD